MRSIVNVVVTCTKDKFYPVPIDCQLRNILGLSLEDRLSHWESSTYRHWEQRVTAKDLYAGDHWVTVKGFESSFFELDIWICSAGYGLIHYTDKVAPYAATFSPRHPDSVSMNLVGDIDSLSPQKWWVGTSKRWKKQLKGRPRTLTALMATYPKRSTVVVASNNYMRAIADDLRTGVGQLRDSDQLVIVASGVKSIESLDENLLPSDARFQSSVGGARRSLNTRLAAKVIRECAKPPRISELRKRYFKLLSNQPPLERYDREPMTDEEIRKFIKKQLHLDPSSRHTRLLRTLREHNKACEQKRFAKLFNDVQERIDGKF
jgi:hypothetical protein